MNVVDHTPERNVLLITHTGRSEARDAARKVAHWLAAAGVGGRVLAPAVGHARLGGGGPGLLFRPEGRAAGVGVCCIQH